jgi:aminoglycoside phosphotransferase (APT) family kinase protein
LTGGVSADVHALELEGPDGHRRTVVVRQYDAAEPKPRHHGQGVAMEYGLLEALHRTGLPVPEPLLLDTTELLLPGPFLVIEFVDGSTDVPADALNACLDVMAATLARLHRMPTEGLPELPLRTDPLPELFDYLPGGAEWRALREHLAGWTDSAYRGPPALLHGDFWPGNLLWRDGRLTAILDWEDAALGDPASDVASCRLELLWKYGSAAVARFTRSYARECPVDGRRLALWEVYVASAAARFMGAWALDPTREAEMRRKAEAFVREAANALLSNHPAYP